MPRYARWFANVTEFIAAALLAAMFATFLLQIYSRYVLVQPFGWTLELCLILWLWIVFFGNAFLVRERDHVTFDILYLAAPRKVQRILALVSAAAIVAGMVWAFVPTWDYIDWMKNRKTTTVRNPLTGAKIPLRTIFSIYAVFMVAVAARYAWRLISIWRHGPPAHEHDLVEEASAPSPRPGDGGA